MTDRQQVLYLWASGSALDSGTIGWAFHDGADGAGPALPDATPPYANGVAALRDGWMLLQSSQLVAPLPGNEHLNDYLEYEFVFERRVDVGSDEGVEHHSFGSAEAGHDRHGEVGEQFGAVRDHRMTHHDTFAITSISDTVARMNDWNAQIIAEFRASGGKAAQFGDNPLVILHTIGAKSGELREIPLVAFVDGDDLYVFASRGGAPTNPDWYYNLKATPEITVEYGTETFTATVTELPEDEGQAKLRAQAELMPQFGEYITSAAPRVIPAFHIARNA